MKSDPKKIVSRSMVVPADAQEIFDLLADPQRHSEIDGSGSVQRARGGAPQRLSLGATFGMDMRIGVPYRITNTVVEFEEGRRIAWQHFGGHVWRYILQPVDGGTNVTEEFDWTNSKSMLTLRLMNAQKRNAISIEKTLANIRDRFTR